MARFNTSLAVEYVDDFGFESLQPLPFRIHADAPIPNDFYVSRPASNVCGSSSVPYETRAIRAYFNLSQNRTASFRYPIPTKIGDTGIEALGQALINLGAVCLDLIGERWVLVTNRIFDGNPPSFRTVPISGVPGEPEKESIFYDYISDLTGSLPNAIQLSTNYETEPTALANVSRSCLLNVQVKRGTSICTGTALGINPRRFLWRAARQDSPDVVQVDGLISRQSIISSNIGDAAINCLRDIAGEIYCTGYEGESIRNLQNII